MAAASEQKPPWKARFRVGCELRQYKVFVEPPCASTPGDWGRAASSVRATCSVSQYQYDLSPALMPNCSDKLIERAPSGAVALSVPYEGSCGVSREVCLREKKVMTLLTAQTSTLPTPLSLSLSLKRRCSFC